MAEADARAACERLTDKGNWRSGTRVSMLWRDAGKKQPGGGGDMVARGGASGGVSGGGSGRGGTGGDILGATHLERSSAAAAGATAGSPKTGRAYSGGGGNGGGGGAGSTKRTATREKDLKRLCVTPSRHVPVVHAPICVVQAPIWVVQAPICVVHAPICVVLSFPKQFISCPATAVSTVRGFSL
jgi:hypothetical protein